MLDDRPYMRDPLYGSRKSITIILLITLAVCFVVQSVIYSYSRSGTGLLYYLELSGNVLRRGYLWQFVTFQFLHAGFFHVLFNCLTLYFVGNALETAMSRGNWLRVYFGAGLFGGLLHAMGNLITPYNFPTPVVGASAGLMGLIAAFACMFRGNIVRVYFVIPVPAAALFYILMGLSIFWILVPAGGPGYAHGAHLGGLLFGWAYVKWFMHYEWKFPAITFFRRPKVFVKTRRASKWPEGKAPERGDLPSEEFISREVDPILDKISAHGIQSLTERERKILEAARAKMAKR